MLFRTLLTMCRRELDRNSAAELPFLHNETFHKSLFGCCMEISAYTMNKTAILVRHDYCVYFQ